jgi:hypothetical protein
MEETSKIRQQWGAIPGWFKVILGFAGLLISWKMFPILELLNLFALIVLVPLCLLGSVGLIADGAGAAARTAWNSTMERAADMAKAG